MIRYVLCAVLGMGLLAACSGEPEERSSVSAASETFSEAINGLQHTPGFFDIYAGDNKVLAVLPSPDEDGLVLSMILSLIHI